MPGRFDEARATLDEGNFRSLGRWSGNQQRTRTMREHSGGAEGKNNNRNPTLKDREREKGRSGAADLEPKEAADGPSRVKTTRP
jgi:hypothetical protein